MYTVQYLVGVLIGLKFIDGEWVQKDTEIYHTREVEMLNARYGKVKTDVKVTQDFKKLSHREEWKRGEVIQIKEGPYHPSDAFDLFSFQYSRYTDSRETYLYDVIDTATGYVLVRTLDPKKFVDLIVKDGFYLFSEEDVEMECIKGSGYSARRVTERTHVAVYACGMREFRTYKRYELTRTEQ